MIALHISEYAVSKELDYYNLGIVPKGTMTKLACLKNSKVQGNLVTVIIPGF